MSFVQLALTLKKGSYKLRVWLLEMGSEPPWTQTFSEELLKYQHLKINALLCFLLVLVTEVSRGSVGNMEA